MAAIKAECDPLVAMPRDSGRNNALNRAAFCLGQLVGGGEVSAGDAEHALVDACIANRLVNDDGMRSVLATITSGMSAGLLHPRTRHGRRS
jgi:putative DNA primase/helicase